MVKKAKYVIFAILAGFLQACTGPGAIRYENGAVPPEEAVATYEVADGFQIELFASEPLIADPVDMEIDENGRMYVVEMPGYPLDETHTGRIKLLTDENGDGVMDKSVVFADKLLFPNGILRWKKGFLVTDAPYVLYLEDQDGDGISDRRDTLLTGFSLSNPHVNVNNPIYGLDNWIYLSHFGSIGTRKYQDKFGDQGEEIRFWKQEDGPSLPRNAGNKNVRFKPDGSGLEMRSVKGQFGHTFDTWGHHFLTHNSNHIYQEVLAPQYLNRNTATIISTASEDISDHGNSTEVFQITTNPDRQLFTPVGLSTSTSGLTYYSGGLFPAPYSEGVTFVAESVSNLVHADRLVSRGGTYTASRLEDRKEFLASRDYWARPVNMYVGPDGALYVLDYYRRVIEHPEWMSDEAIRAGDLYDGHEMGRIYRITPEGTPAAEWTRGLGLGKKSSAALVEYLENGNRWWRINAQRLLVDRKDPATVPLLEKMAANSRSEYGRLHALWTLEGLGELQSGLIKQALNDPCAGIRENAIRLAERYLGEDETIKEQLYAMVSDTSENVQFQLLTTLGWVKGERAAAARNFLLFQHVEDEWVQRAAMTAEDLDTKELLKKVLKQTGGKEGPAYYSLVQRLTATLTETRDRAMIMDLLKRSISANGSEPVALQSALLTGLAAGLEANERPPAYLREALPPLLNAFFEHRSPEIREHALTLLIRLGEPGSSAQWKTDAVDKAMQRARDTALHAVYRSQMLRLLLLTDTPAYERDLQQLIIPAEEPAVQTAALEMYGRIPGPGVAEYVLRSWDRMTPEIREAALNTFLTEDERVELLLSAVETGRISRQALGWDREVRLNQYGNETIRKRARALLTRDNSPETAKRYAVSLEMKGDIQKGLEVYKANCALCHQVRGQLGAAYGPDLGTVHNWEPKDLLANILEPGSSIAPGFDLWEVELGGGEKIQGMIRSETSNAIELKTGPQSERTIKRQDVKELKSLPGLSMMPGFGGQLDEQEMADLIAFLRNSYSVL